MLPHSTNPASEVGVPANDAPPVPELPPPVQQALETFHRDLPQLLQERPGQWVAYSGDRRLGFGRTKTQLYQECVGGGLAPGQFLVRLIRPQVDMDLIGSW